MRFVMYIAAALAVMGLGFWAYQENYRTQTAIKDVRRLQAQIGDAHERLGMLRAEWAYLNRPDRLTDLAELNFDRLGLLPLSPDSFGDARYIVYPIPDILPITNPIDVTSIGPSTEEDPL
ncbi:cell division protein FtsL [Loktanella sp. TSTF-M6]|uniref:Cell division protein FtsL n=1 Tax=Loktanella gaetbuli TaxID=2881335 RepID=A0ABS8BPH0_9RHOB|nr:MULTISPECIES: cell division protein FtsL [Loktanella]MCB5197621.1 cell division protein FtsL [Loktanella gaetbuli]